MKIHPSIHLPSLGVLRFLPLLFLCGLAHAATIHFHADLSGSAESPANASPGMGYADVYIDDIAQTMQVKATFWDLLEGVTAAHIHAATAVPNTGTASVATQTPTFLGFPSAVTLGSYDNTFDLTLASTYRAGFITANGGSAATAAVALVNAFYDEKAYFNIHTTKFPGGEIRGFLSRVPDSGTTALLLTLALGALAGFSRVQKLRAG